jgi:hypothetical protein
MRSLAMGFPRSHLTAPSIPVADRHRLLGSCIDGNICRWIVDVLCASAPAPSTWFLHSHVLEGPSPPQLWKILLDSGSSSHLWPSVSEFSTYEPHPDGPIWVGGIKAWSYGSGSIQMRFKTSTGTIIAATLNDVLYVPDMAQQPGGPVRLFSTSAASDQSGSEVTTGVNTRITLKNGLVIPGRRDGRHFFVDAIPGFLPTDDQPCAFMTSTPPASAQQRSLWHARLCHMSHVAVDRVLLAHKLAPRSSSAALQHQLVQPTAPPPRPSIAHYSYTSDEEEDICITCFGDCTCDLNPHPHQPMPQHHMFPPPTILPT